MRAQTFISTTMGVEQLLADLDPNKATNSVPACTLKMGEKEIAPALVCQVEYVRVGKHDI